MIALLAKFSSDSLKTNLNLDISVYRLTRKMLKGYLMSCKGTKTEDFVQIGKFGIGLQVGTMPLRLPQKFIPATNILLSSGTSDPNEKLPKRGL